MPFLWLKYRRPAALALSAACKETQCLPSSKGPPSHPGSSSRCQPLPQPPQHPLHALLPPHQPPSPAAHDPPSAPTRFRRTAHAVSAPLPPRPDPPLPRPRFKIKGPPALAPSPSGSTYLHFSTDQVGSLPSPPPVFASSPCRLPSVPCSSSPRSKPLRSLPLLPVLLGPSTVQVQPFLLRVLPRCQASRLPCPPSPPPCPVNDSTPYFQSTTSTHPPDRPVPRPPSAPAIAASHQDPPRHLCELSDVN